MVFMWVKINRWKSISRKLLSPDKFVPLENISQNCHQGLFHHSHISQVSGRYPHPDSHRLSRRSRTYWLALLLKRQTFRKYAIAIGDKYQCVKESNAKAKHWWLWCWESSRCWERQRVELRKTFDRWNKPAKPAIIVTSLHSIHFHTQLTLWSKLFGDSHHKGITLLSILTRDGRICGYAPLPNISESKN